MNILRRWALQCLDLLCCSCILRARLLALFGARVGADTKVERFFLLNYTGDNLGNLRLGNHVYIGMNTVLDIKGVLTVGDSAKIAAGCNLSTHADCGRENPLARLYPPKIAPVSIGAHSWLGLGVTVLCGVTIGEHAVIGAGSVVTRDVPPNSLALGVPATIRKKPLMADVERAL